MLVSGFREFFASHPELKKIALAQAIDASPSTLSMILSGARNPTASQVLAILNLVRGSSTKIVNLQENSDPRYYVNGDPDQRIELNDCNLDYLAKFARRIDCTVFDNSRRVAREGADPSDDPANSAGDITSIANRKTGIKGTDGPSLENLLGQLDILYKQIGDILATQTVKKAVPNKSGTSRTSQTLSR